MITEKLTKQEKIPQYPWTCSGRKPFTKDPKCNDPDFEYTWDRVLRMRKERHPLIKGGRARGADFNCRTTHHTQRVILGYDFCQHCHERLYQHGPSTGTEYKPRRK